MTSNEINQQGTPSDFDDMTADNEATVYQPDIHTSAPTAHRQEWAQRRLSALPPAALISAPRTYNRQKINP